MTIPSHIAAIIMRIRSQLPHPIASPADVRFGWVTGPQDWTGAYVCRSNTVQLHAQFRHMVAGGDMDMALMLAPTVAHELHHAWQAEHQPARFLAARALWMRWLIERSADEVEQAASALCGNPGLMTGD
jgi:hypothetical protein